MSTRSSIIQLAEAAIRREIIEGPEQAFFAGIPVLCADEGDIEASVERAIAETAIAIVCEVSGGPVPACPGDAVPWRASVSVAEIPALNRAGPSGKTADLVLEALLRTYATPGRPDAVFTAQDVEKIREKHNGKPVAGYVVLGEIHIVPVSGDAPGEESPFGPDF